MSLKEECPVRKRAKLDLHLKCDEKLEIIKKESDKITKRPIDLPPPCHCIQCFDYMGETNPRQYCCKSYCECEGYNEEELLQQKVYNLRRSPYYCDSSYPQQYEYYDSISLFIDENYVDSVSD